MAQKQSQPAPAGEAQASNPEARTQTPVQQPQKARKRDTMEAKISKFMEDVKADQVVLSDRVSPHLHSVEGFPRDVLNAQIVAGHYNEILDLLNQVKLMYPSSK